MTDVPTREQEEYIDGLASRFGSTCVRRFDEDDAMLLVCGWESGPGFEDSGRRAEGSSWEWLDADGSHGPVDGVREALRDLVTAVWPAEGAAAPELAQPPSVPGPPPEDLAREALRQVVQHWPDDLRDITIRVVTGPPFSHGGYRTDVNVALLGTPDDVPLGLFLRFTAQELRSGSPAVAQRIQREHREWTRKHGGA